ncbi:methyltransferase domain-containing protein [Zooshikella ganghwensis]|uniref:methyltransferase domain-containing protein n=1 Tax=Zooshikella ganghwensis TaxID=202772 RepID=UPI000401B34B|nr:methyltransferase domain-containing protein [Zooshikella ganghwensis]
MQDHIKNYYGKVLKKSQDLQTDACTTSDQPTPDIQQAMALVHETVKNRYFGCGFIVPALINDCKVLDLGCGSGRDCYVLAHLVGEKGQVHGVDMTDEQIAVANEFKDYHQKQFSYDNNNVTFYQGYIEDLLSLGLMPNSFDIIVSNCVINLSPAKKRVFEQAYQLLKAGGELYFSDVYASRRVPQTLQNDSQLYGECLSGALYWQDFLSIAKNSGFTDPRLVNDRPIMIKNSEIQQKLKNIEFYSATYRLFKLPLLDDNCEDYGQAVVYKGTIPYFESCITLDKHHIFEKGKVYSVCGNTWRMLNETRFKPHFEFIGSFDKHFGPYTECGIDIPFDKAIINESTDRLGCC